MKCICFKLSFDTKIQHLVSDYVNQSINQSPFIPGTRVQCTGWSKKLAPFMYALTLYQISWFWQWNDFENGL